MKTETFEIQLTEPDGTVEVASKTVTTLYGDSKDALKTATQMYTSEVMLLGYKLTVIGKLSGARAHST